MHEGFKYGSIWTSRSSRKNITKRLSMRVAVVTGVARTTGIGHAICTTLLKSGYAVLGLDHIPIDPTSSLLEQNCFCAKVASVTDLLAVQSSIAQGMEELKKQQHQKGESTSTINVVVNNAGIPQPFLQPPPCYQRYWQTRRNTRKTTETSRRVWFIHQCEFAIGIFGHRGLSRVLSKRIT